MGTTNGQKGGKQARGRNQQKYDLCNAARAQPTNERVASMYVHHVSAKDPQRLRIDRLVLYIVHSDQLACNRKIGAKVHTEAKRHLVR